MFLVGRTLLSVWIRAKTCCFDKFCWQQFAVLRLFFVAVFSLLFFFAITSNHMYVKPLISVLSLSFYLKDLSLPCKIICLMMEPFVIKMFSQMLYILICFLFLMNRFDMSFETMFWFENWFANIKYTRSFFSSWFDFLKYSRT